jgi:hypothetical protein
MHDTELRAFGSLLDAQYGEVIVAQDAGSGSRTVFGFAFIAAMTSSRLC